jgi:hypothetical protein
LGGALSALNVVVRLEGLQAPGSVGGPVGALIRGMIPVQAALCLAAGWTDMGLVVIALYPVALVLSRSVSGS